MRTARADQARPAHPQRGAGRGHRRLHQRRQVQPAQPAHRRRRAGRGRAVRHPRPDHPPGARRGRAGLHPVRHGRLRPAPAAPDRRGVPLHAGGGRRGRPGRARGRRRAPRPARSRSARSARCSPRSAPTSCPSCWWSTRPTRRTRRRCCGSSGSGPTRSSSRPAPAPGIDELRAAIEDRLPRPAVEVCVRLPYARGDLVARVHRRGEVLDTRHTDGGHGAARPGRPGPRRGAGPVRGAGRLTGGPPTGWVSCGRSPVFAAVVPSCDTGPMRRVVLAVTVGLPVTLGLAVVVAFGLAVAAGPAAAQAQAYAPAPSGPVDAAPPAVPGRRSARSTTSGSSSCPAWSPPPTATS